MNPITIKIIPVVLLFAFSGFGQQLNCLMPASVSWWRGEGNAADSVGTNSGSWLNGETYVPGEVGQGFDFNGINASIQIPDGPSLRFTNAMTFETWIYPRTIGGHYREIASKWEGGTEDQRSYTITIESGGRFVGTVSSDGGYINITAAFSTNTIPSNKWTHVAFVYDGTAASSYVNGQLHSITPSSSPGIFPGQVPLVIGSTLQSGSFFDGIIDEPAVYSYALSASDIQAIYNAGSAGKTGPPIISYQPHNLVGYWGQSATFSVTAVGGVLGYQWHKEGTDIQNATNAWLRLTNLQATDAVSYSVTVTNACGSTTSSNAWLTVNPAGVSLALYAGITITGVVGFTYGIQYNTDLSNTNGWLGTANVTLGSPEAFWLDLQSANQAHRFYRVLPGPIPIP